MASKSFLLHLLPHFLTLYMHVDLCLQNLRFHDENNPVLALYVPTKSQKSSLLLLMFSLRFSCHQKKINLSVYLFSGQTFHLKTDTLARSLFHSLLIAVLTRSKFLRLIILPVLFLLQTPYSEIKIFLMHIDTIIMALFWLLTLIAAMRST